MKLNQLKTEIEFKEEFWKAILNNLQMGRVFAIIRNAKAKGIHNWQKEFRFLGL